MGRLRFTVKTTVKTTKTAIKKSLLLTTFVFVASFFSACSSTSVDVSNEKDAAKLYNFGLQALKDGDYLTANDAFSEVKKRFSQSRYFALAELRAADLEYEQENFAEAAALYSNFVELNPTNPEAPYAQFRKAKSYIEDNPENEARDQSAAALAASASSQLLKRYPGTNFEKEARDIFYKARLQLAKKEAYIARFYRKKGFHSASQRRWKKIPRDFQDLKDYEPAKELFAEASLAIKNQRSSKN